MKKLRGKLASRSSSASRSKALDIAQKHSTGGSLAHVSTTGQVVSDVGGTESQPKDPLKQFEVNSGHCPNTSPDPDSTDVTGEPPDQAISLPVDGDLQSLRNPTSLPGPAKEDKTGPGHNDALPALNSSSLWQKAMEIVKTDEDWERYVAIIAKNAELHGSDVDSPEGVVQIAKKLSDQLETSKTTLRLAGRIIVVRDVLNKVLNVLALSKDLGTALTSLNPYASTGWKGLQFFIQAAVANEEVAALCWDELPRMVRLMSQYQTFETIYNTSMLKNTKIQLEAALVLLFSAILRYQVVIVKYASSRTDRFKAAFQGKVASMPQRVLDDIKQHEAEVIRMQSLADRETLNIQFQALAESYRASSQELEKGFIELQEANLRAQDLGTMTATYLESISEWTEVTRRDAILSWVSTIKHRDAHNNRDKKAMEGTGEWLIRHPEYLHWRSSNQAAVLWLHGLMGSGKSCLARTVIEDLKLLTSTSVVKKLAYFYCNGSSEEGRKDIESADNIWRCLLQQLARVGENSKLMNSIIKIYTDIHLEGHLSEDQCMDLIRDLINKSETTTFVIDGLDECSLEVQNSLMSSIAGLLEGCTNPLRIFVSSRHNDNIVDLLQDLPVAEISVGHNNTEDIEIFIRCTAHHAASRPGDRRKYVKSGQSQELAVVDRLLEKAGGMFRWVDLAFKFLHTSVDYDAMSSRLEQLSQLGQLFDLYDEIYDDMMRRVDAADQARIRTLLMFMLHGQHFDLRFFSSYPFKIVHMAEILEACEFSVTASLYNMPMNVERVRALCPDLVVVTSKLLTCELAFPHFSVREWLLASSKYSSLFARHPGNVYLIQLCMKVIVASGIQPIACIDKREERKGEFTRSTRGNALLQYRMLSLIDHLLVLPSEQKLSHFISKNWSEDDVLRTTLEDFVFKLDKRDLELPDRLTTGFHIWHRLLRRQSEGRGWLETGDTHDLIRQNILVPAFICGHLRYYCDLSRVQEAAMEVAGTQLEWPVQSLAVVMSMCDFEALRWLLEQLHPSPEVLTQALLQYVFSCIWCRGYETLNLERRQSRAEIICRMRLLVASGIDVNGRYGPYKTTLIELLLAAWLGSECKRACGKGFVAIIIACLSELGLDILVSVHISSKIPLNRDDREYSGFYAGLQTVFDWLLYWDAVSQLPGIEALFLAQQWSKPFWTRWLTLAARYTAGSFYNRLAKSCLELSRARSGSNDD